MSKSKNRKIFLKAKQASEFELKECPNKKGYTLLNLNTGEIGELNCNTYYCDYCGPRKVARLKKAIYEAVRPNEYVRMFTFTFRSTHFVNQEHCIIRAREIWRRFINNIRRDKSLSKKARNFQYIKLVEFHLSGYPHFHVLGDQYMPQKVLYYHWRNAINTVMGWDGNHGTVNAKGHRSARGAAYYVAKYVTKTSKSYEKYNLAPVFNWERRRFRLYSKSSMFKLFPKKCPIHRWQFGMEKIVKEGETPQESPLTCSSYSQLPHDSYCFEIDLPPPITFRNYNTPEMKAEMKIWAEYREKIINHFWYFNNQLKEEVNNDY